MINQQQQQQPKQQQQQQQQQWLLQESLHRDATCAVLSRMRVQTDAQETKHVCFQGHLVAVAAAAVVAVAAVHVLMISLCGVFAAAEGSSAAASAAACSPRPSGRAPHRHSSSSRPGLRLPYLT